jgi:hypothetical protein
MSDERISQASGMALFQLGGAAVGGVLGAFLGNPQLGLKIGRKLGALGGTIFYRVKNNQKDRDQTDMERHTVQISTYGAPIPLLYGTTRSAGNIIWATDIRSTTLIGETTPAFRSDFAISFGEGPAVKFLRLFANGRLIYSVSADDLTGFAASPALQERITLYLGTASQPIDPTIESIEGAGNCPTFKNLVYAVFRSFPLTEFGDELPVIEAEITMSASLVSEKQTFDAAPFSADDPDNFVIAQSHATAYLDAAGTILFVNRLDLSQSGTVIDTTDFLTQISGGLASRIGRIAIDEESPSTEGQNVYFCGTNGDDSFLCIATPTGFTTLYPTVNADAVESEIFVKGNYAYTGANNATIRAYDKLTLLPQWTRTGPNTGAVPGNFTVDNRGDLWLISYLSADPDSGPSSQFFLTRFSEGGNRQDYTITGQGKCKNIAFCTDSDGLGGQSLYVGGGASGVLLQLTNPPSGAPSVSDTLAGVSGELSTSGFVSQHRFSGGFFYTCDGTNIYEVNVAGSMAINDTFALSGYGISGTLGGWAYDAPNRAIWVAKNSSGEFYKLFIDRFSEDPPSLGSVISDLCQRAGLTTDEIDTSDAYLTSTTITGLLINERSTAQQILERLLLAYSVGKRESFQSGFPNIKIQFLARGGTPVLSLTEDDLGAGEDSSEDVSWLLERDTEQSIPRVVTIRYIDKQFGYRESEQMIEIEEDILPSTAELDVSLPIILSAQQAKNLAEILLMSLYTEANAVRVALPPRFATLECEDVILVTRSSISYRLRVVSKSQQVSGRSEVILVQENPETYSSLAEVDDPIGVDPPSVDLIENSTALLLDLACCRDADDVPGFYAVGAPSDGGTAWDGCVLHVSSDGIVFSPAVGITLVTASGQAQTPLGDTPTNTTWDDTNNILVLMLAGELDGATDAEIYANRRKNLFAIGSPATGWELVQVGTVTLNATVNGRPQYLLSHFLRGRFGTEWRAATHEIGERVVHLDFESGAVQTVETAIGETDQARFYKAVTVGQDPATVGAQLFVNTMARLRPYAPGHVVAYNDTPASNDWTINFNRRARKGHDLINGSDIALGESVEQYEIEILASPDGAVFRTLTVGPGLWSTSGVNISVTSGTQLITRASGSWLTDGFLVGQWVDLAGFTNADNNNRFRVTAITATTLTLGHGPRSLITEASASGRTVTAATPAVVYTEAQQIADGGVKSTFHCNIYQISGRAEVGRGYVTSTLIE